MLVSPVEENEVAERLSEEETAARGKQSSRAVN